MKVHHIQRLAIVFMLLVALIGGSWAASQPSAVEAATINPGTTTFTFLCATGQVTFSTTGTWQQDDGWPPYGGDVIMVELTDPTDGDFTFMPASFETPASTTASNTMVLGINPKSSSLQGQVFESTGGDVGVALTPPFPVNYPCLGGGGGAGATGGAAPAEKKVGPGPDMIPIPAGGAVGTFVADTTLLFAPNAGAWTGLTMKAGQSLWVFGVDESGQFYQVVLAGQKLWVPVAAMAPTHDKYWDGKKLPDATVK